MKTGNKFSGFMMVFGISGILYGVQLLFSVAEMSPGRWHTICLLGYGMICYTVNSLWLKREKTVNMTVLVNGVLAGVFLGIMFLRFGTGGGKQAAFTVAFCLFLTYYGVKLNLRPPKATHLILYLDVSVVLIILLVIVMDTMERSILAAAPLASGIIALLLGLMAFHLHSFKAWLVPGVLFVVLMALFGVMMSVARYFGRLITAAFGGILFGLRYIGSQIERFLLYLTTLMKADTYEEVTGEAFGIPSGAMEAAQQFQNGMGIIIGLIILAFFVFVLIMALRILGKSGISGKRIKSANRQRHHTPPFWGVFKEFFREIKENIQYSILVIGKRNTPWGLYYFLRAVTGKRKCGIKTGETPKAFLCRLSAQLPETGQELVVLIPEIEKALFSTDGNSVQINNANRIIRESIKLVLFSR